jgi:hypothetical protein
LKGGKARKVDSAQWKQVQKFRKEWSATVCLLLAVTSA